MLSLTYDEARLWWEKNYAGTSGVHIFSYGDINVTAINELVSEYIPVLKSSTEFYPALADQTISNSTISKPVSIHRKYPASPYSAGSTYGLSFKVPEGPAFKNIDLEILSFILFNTPNSPFFTTFLASESPIATGFCPNIGYNAQTRIFTVGFQNLTTSVNFDSPSFVKFDRSRFAEFVNFEQSSIVELKAEVLQELVLQILESCFSSEKNPHNFDFWIL
jgi:Zn-dependent M16 (insulinase) family peptidase